MPLREIEATAERLVIEMPSAFEYLEQLLERMEAFLVEALSNEDLIYNIELLISEAATNAIEHGNRDDASLLVKVTVEVAQDTVRVAVTDEGKGFVREDVEDPTSEENLLRSGGRGLFLIESLADEVFYEDEGRTIRMAFHRAG